MAKKPKLDRTNAERQARWRTQRAAELARLRKAAGEPVTTKTISKQDLRPGRTSQRMIETLIRFWDGLPVVDSTVDLIVKLEGVDYEHAKAKDMFNCAFVQAVRRLYGATHAIFTKTVAYVDLILEDGIRRVYRFSLSHSARNVIVSFDTAVTDQQRAAVALKNGNFVLHAPTKSKTLEGMRTRNSANRKKRKQRENRRLFIRGEAVCVRGKKAQPKPPPAKTPPPLEKGDPIQVLELTDVRLGTGKIQFQIGAVKPSALKNAEAPIKVVA